MQRSTCRRSTLTLMMPKSSSDCGERGGLTRRNGEAANSFFQLHVLLQPHGAALQRHALPAPAHAAVAADRRRRPLRKVLARCSGMQWPFRRRVRGRLPSGHTLTRKRDSARASVTGLVATRQAVRHAQYYRDNCRVAGPEAGLGLLGQRRGQLLARNWPYLRVPARLLLLEPVRGQLPGATGEQ